MKQTIIKSFGPLTNLGTNIIGGLTQLEEVLGIVHVPKIKVETNLLALITSNTAFQNGRLLMSERRETVRVLTRRGRELIMLTRDMLKPRFGSQFSIAWLVLGFHDSLEAPTSPDEVKLFLRAIKEYFAANPMFEVPALGITSTLAESLLNDLNAAEIAVNMQDSELGILRDTRDAALDAMDATIRNFVGELSLKLGPSDQRWKAFGLNVPGAEETPDKPEEVKVTLIEPTVAAVEWKAPGRAQYSRVWIKVRGVDTDYVAVGSPVDPDFMIENLPANSTMDIVITALNDGGESPMSDVITIMTP